MRCRKHPADESSTVGVCASCLRHRLFSLIQLQSQPPPSPPPPPPPAPPLIFPRSVSPYICRRKSDPPIQRFYSTPQLGPTSSTIPKNNKSKKQSSSSGKFGLISKLFFRSRSRSRSFPSEPENQVAGKTSICRRDKGMSPDPGWDDSESPVRGMTRPSPCRVRPSPSRTNVAGLAFCLSPLVRASPARHWGGGSSEAGYSGEIRVPVTGNKPHLSVAASFCANRSRKVADFGRLNRNR